ncbi:MAG: exodeoxyribonuclease VII small subunit [Gemmatimonadetes bacterium]|nr:exodeoxyribonuclease VII small subunit [Gemmatimonadota bacterium]
MATDSGRQGNSAAEPKGARRAESFEEAFSKLEEIVRRLEDGKLSLDEATRLFEDGMRMAKRCNELLSSAELKVSRLQREFAEQMSLVEEELEETEEEIGEAEDPG